MPGLVGPGVWVVVLGLAVARAGGRAGLSHSCHCSYPGGPGWLLVCRPVPPWENCEVAS